MVSDGVLEFGDTVEEGIISRKSMLFRDVASKRERALLFVGALLTMGGRFARMHGRCARQMGELRLEYRPWLVL
jgi:hypothetical protein